MKKLFTFYIVLSTVVLFAQTPISHLPGVSFTFSGSYYAAGGNATKDFIMCNSWNSGTYGGWLQMDLGSTITLESLRWWVGMSPNGTVTELVEVSADGTTWTTAANTSGPRVSLEEIKLVFDPVIPNVRYIRISQSATPSWFAILEMVVNEPYYANNIYTNMPPKILDSSGNELTGPVSGYPYTLVCSQAVTYQWYKDGAAISGATNQEYIATSIGSYSCDVTYATANCGFPTSSNAAIVEESLPLDLISFNALEQKDKGILNWNVANLINFSHFEIERSSNGNRFETIDKTYSRGEGRYSYIDENPLSGRNYYRLKMVDKDAQFTYSPVRALFVKTAEINIFPNPANENKGDGDGGRRDNPI